MPPVVATVSVPLATGTVPLPLVWAANVVRSANVIRAGIAEAPPCPGGVTSAVLLTITSDCRYGGELAADGGRPINVIRAGVNVISGGEMVTVGADV